MMIRLAGGAVYFLDYREQAPLAATRDMYLDADGKATDKSQIGYLAPATPGTVMGLVEAQRRFGIAAVRRGDQPGDQPGPEWLRARLDPQRSHPQ